MRPYNLRVAAVLLEGKRIAERITRDVRARAERLRRERGTVPHLVMVRVAGSDASGVYSARLEATCESAGIRFSERRIPPASGERGIVELLEVLGRDAAVHGILVEMPLPPEVDLARVRAKIDPAKDVERINPMNQGLVVYGAVELAPCTAMAAMEILLDSKVPLAGKEAVVVGASGIVGKPVALMLLGHYATTTVCHKETRDLDFHTRRADILVAAVGKAGLITREMVKPGAVVVDIGVNRVAGPDGKSRLVGDVDFDAVREVAGFLTPVPGGVGLVTTAVTLRNAVAAAESAGN